MKDVIRTFQFSTWEELKACACKYSQMGYEVRVYGWDDIRNNRLSILDDWAEGDEEMSKCKSCGKAGFQVSPQCGYRPELGGDAANVIPTFIGSFAFLE